MAVHRIPEGTPEWHAMRLKNIGASESGALFGQSPHVSDYTLHAVKSGKIPAPPVDDGVGSRIWFGKKLEATIAALAAELYQWKIEKGGYYTDPIIAGMGCSLDYLITEPGPAEKELGFTGPGVLQIKNIDWLQHARGWVGGEPPLSIILQVQHEMACAECTWGVIVGMVGGNQLPVYRYAARPVVANEIRARIAAFWQRVRDGKPPNTDASQSTFDAIRALYPTVPTPAPIDMTGNNRFPDLCAQFSQARAHRKESNRRYDEARNEIEALLEGGTWAAGDGWEVRASVVKEIPPRPARADEVIGGRKESRRLTVSEAMRK